jgi:hypothetical protein
MRLSTVAIAAVCATLATLVVTAPAQAIGNNRAVERSCGKNYVSSGIRSTGRSWAMTQKQSGTCAGPAERCARAAQRLPDPAQVRHQPRGVHHRERPCGIRPALGLRCV